MSAGGEGWRRGLLRGIMFYEEELLFTKLICLLKTVPGNWILREQKKKFRAIGMVAQYML